MACQLSKLIHSHKSIKIDLESLYWKLVNMKKVIMKQGKFLVFYLAFGCLLYVLHYSIFNGHHLKSDGSDVALNQVLLKRDEIFDAKKPGYLPNIQFTKDDMLDEQGNEYTILIWPNEENPSDQEPGYKANPEECQGYINCKITSKEEFESTAHALVFRGLMVSENHLPSTSLKEHHQKMWPALSDTTLEDDTPSRLVSNKISMFNCFDKNSCPLSDVGVTKDVEKGRKPHQLYAWWESESPLHSAVGPDKPNYYNLTFHYRTDADIYAPYGSINLILRELKKAGETDLDELLAKKRNSKKIAAWAVSNCYSKRSKFARSLISFGLQVDGFGFCFRSRKIGDGPYSESFYKALSNYKFYFSFENSITCKDYFTEKFWFNGLRSGAVPIVWGPSKEDILKVAPTKSFIHADDFSSPNELVKYLNYLISNETAYAEYLQWRTWVNHPERIEERLQMKNRDNDLRSFCKLCSIIQEHGRLRKLKLPTPVKTIPSIKNAWFGPDERCHR